MSRTLIAVLIAGCVVLPAVAAPITGLLNEMIPWPMLSAAIPMRQLILSDEPFEALSGLPFTSSGGGAPVYGLIPLCDGSDPGISVIVWIGSEIRLLVDTDNDESLADESGLYARERIMAHAYTWYVTISLEYEGEAAPAPYFVTITGAYSHASGTYDFLYGGFCQRRGALGIGPQVIPIAITSQVSTGRYDNLSTLLVSVDIDANGTLDTLPGSHEVFLPGEPIQIGPRSYRIVSVSPSGRRITLEDIGETSPRPVIQRNSVAPDFLGRTSSGQEIRLSDFRGRIVVLILEESGLVNCPGCVAASVDHDTRTAAACHVLRHVGEDVAILSVPPGSPPVGDHPTSGYVDGSIAIYSDEAFSTYRRHTGLFVLDQEMRIAEMDEAWFTVRCDRPTGRLDLLNEFELRQSVERLLTSMP